MAEELKTESVLLELNSEARTMSQGFRYINILVIAGMVALRNIARAFNIYQIIQFEQVKYVGLINLKIYRDEFNSVRYKIQVVLKTFLEPFRQYDQLLNR